MTPELAHTADMPVGQLDNIIIPSLGEPLVREAESITPVAAPMTSDDFDMLMFMEELVRIRIETLPEKNPRKFVDVYVNGKVEWIPVGQPWILRRKFVEVLARAKPINIQTKHESAEQSLDPKNEIVRTVYSQFPFTVIQDTPRGIEWLNRIIAEG